MQYRFTEFEFDCEQLVLSRQGQVIALHEKPAQLLKVFLTQPDSIHSKEQLLTQVWPDRVVTDQVVFQNISYLRALFGNEAIKTFSKKGYQWQLPLVLLPEPEQPELSRIKPGKKLSLILVACSLLLVALGISPYLRQLTSDTVENIHPTVAQHSLFLPVSARINGQLSPELEQFNTAIEQRAVFTRINPQLLQADANTQAFFNSPHVKRSQWISHPEQLVISGFLQPRKNAPYKTDQQYQLEYLIQGQYRSWHGYLLADNVSQLEQQLANKMEYLLRSQYFALEVDAFTTAELSLLFNQHPQDLDILKHLIQRLLQEDRYDVADARIEQMQQLAQEQQHPAYSAFASWFKGQLFYGRQQYQQASHMLQLAEQAMGAANMPALQSEVNKSLADIALQQKDFVQIQSHLYQAASQARLAARPVQEIRAYTLLSIMASKLGLQEDKYQYLHQAKTLLADYQLDSSHYMLVFYHFALFSKEQKERIHFYQQVLSQTVTPDNYWVFFSSADQLADIYIRQQQWQKALDLSETVTDTARHASLKAKIYQAKGEPDKAAKHAEVAFNSARSQHIEWLAMNMALLLLELQVPEANSDDLFVYRDYIQRFSKSWWRQYHAARLEKLQVFQ